MKSKALLLTAALFALLLSFTGSTASAEGPNAIITSAGCQATELPANDDGSSPQVALPFNVNFFGNTFGSLWVNNNGNVTFNGPLGAFTPSPIVSESTPIIAPFWADVDTRGAGSGTTHYGDITAGDTQVGGHAAFCVNWINVGYFGGHTDKLNSFQLVLVDRSDTGAGNFDIVFNYDKVQWETGDASGGSNGLGGSSARAGYSNGSTASFELTGSAVNGAFLDSNTANGLIFNNINSPLQQGRYVFPVRNGAATGHSLSGHIYANDNSHPVSGAFVQACPTPFDTPCRLATSGADGSYSLPNLPDHTSGGGVVDHNWNLVVNPPGGSGLNSGTAGPIAVNGSDVSGVDVTLHGPQPLPGGASVTQTGRGTQSTGVPTVYWGSPFTLTISGCSGGNGSATLLAHEDGYAQTVGLAEGPAGVYTATFAPVYPHHGNASISWTLSCGTTGGFDLYIDPSGVVKDTNGNPVSGATVTLFRADDPAGPFVQVPDGSAIMSPGNRANPDTTDATGHFGWDVVAGYYKVEASKAGCTATPGSTSAVLTIPPPVTDLELTLDCGTSDANIQIGPATAINPVSTNHTLTGQVNVNTGGGFVNAPNGTVINFSITAGTGSFVLGVSQCTTAGGSGSCTVQITSTTAGATTVKATTDIVVNGQNLHRETDATGTNSGPANKSWADDTVSTRVLDASNTDVTGSTSVAPGTVVHDEATVAKTADTPAAVPDPSGTVTFTLYDNTACNGNVLSTEANVPLTVGGVATSSTFTVAASGGTFSYLAHYSGDANYPSHDGPCESFQSQTAPQLADLHALIDGFSLNKPLRDDLQHKVSEAEKRQGQGKSICAQLNDLMRTAIDHAGKDGLSFAEATQLLDAANAIEQAAGCTPAGSPRPKAEDDLVNLMATIAGMSLAKPEGDDLTNRARDAAKKVVDGNSAAYCKALGDLSSKIAADTGKPNKLTPAQGATLSAAVTSIRSALGC